MNNKVEEIKKEDKKHFKSFIFTIAICTIMGGIFGFMSVKLNLKESLGESVPRLFADIFYAITPFASLFISIIIMFIGKIIYNNSKQGYKLWEQKGEDDDSIEKIEVNLSYLLLFVSVNIILGLFFLSMGFMLNPFMNKSGDLSVLKISCFVIGFIVCIVSSTIIQKRVVNLEKEINPLLKGSIYDIKFSEKFLDSCDEAIKLEIFKSSYKSFKIVNLTCISLWVFCIVGYTLWDFGVIPMAVVIFILLVQTISYILESIKCSKAK